MLVEPHGPLQFPGEAGPAVAQLAGTWADRLRAAGRRPRVALPESGDTRTLWAAARLAGQGSVTPVLLGDPATVRNRAADLDLKLPEDPEALEILDPAAMARDPRCGGTLGEALARRRKLSRADREELAADPLYLAATALALGDADVCVAGSNRPTADVLRAGLYVVGLAPGVRTLSSSFLMVQPDGGVLGYGDCAVVVDPDPRQLADIARATARTYRELTDARPRVALLSFSTGGSADHPRVDRVREALELLRAEGTDFAVDGDLQYDAASDPEVGRAKAPSSPVAGQANTFVFPGLEAGNISYKVAQRVGGCAAIGPLLQGLAAPLHDLSRGCTGADIAALALAGGVQALSRTPSTNPVETPCP
ncbi:phosphotransacetylase [Streptomyces iconiensis]|uniref:Phosphotransacetylase n=1 Tax=Streptomyces iconiensis TaxID=1384038 RepID=A0ABT7A0R5_9ACTN|nr:phosphotransacetylase [Streptomyces iconiensis]MDJ1134927.1 phosphotransacetylase [Streptomyces iconiensis]